MGKTKIEWVKNPDGSQGYTLNPIKGKCPMACPYCYARRMYDRFKWNPEPRWDSKVMEQLRLLKKPSGIFLCSTFEWLWDESWAYNIYSWMKAFPQHRFYTLTKMPERLPQLSPFPGNCWVGITATNPQMFYEAQIYLEKIVATVRYISIEPYLTQIVCPGIFPDVIDWIIIGGQTNPTRLPEISWVEDMTRAADWANIVKAPDRVGIPVFQKDNLKSLLGNNLRQDMPKETVLQRC